MELTESQFAVIQDAIDGMVRASRSASARDRRMALAISDEWEAACTLPVGTAKQRETRRAAIYAVAKKHSLV